MLHVIQWPVYVHQLPALIHCWPILTQMSINLSAATDQWPRSAMAWTQMTTIESRRPIVNPAKSNLCDMSSESPSDFSHRCLRWIHVINELVVDHSVLTTVAKSVPHIAITTRCKTGAMRFVSPRTRAAISAEIRANKDKTRCLIWYTCA